MAHSSSVYCSTTSSIISCFQSRSVALTANSTESREVMVTVPGWPYRPFPEQVLFRALYFKSKLRPNMLSCLLCTWRPPFSCPLEWGPQTLQHGPSGMQTTKFWRNIIFKKETTVTQWGFIQCNSYLIQNRFMNRQPRLNYSPPRVTLFFLIFL